jgi:hypothetical protein
VDQATNKSYDTNNPSIEGWMSKQSTWLKDWRRRYFVLKDSKLFFAKNETCAPHGMIDLSTCMTVKSAELKAGRKNSIEVSKRQLIVVQWSETRGNTPGKKSSVESKGIDEKDTSNADFAADLIANGTSEIKEAWQECEQLRKAILKNNGMKKSIAKRLRHNEREAEKFRDELSTKITGEDRRELMELQYQVGRLELENMELEQHRIVHESILKGKDLVIQKLKLQLIDRTPNILTKDTPTKLSLPKQLRKIWQDATLQ